jgi:hypothetical protein
MTFPLSDRGSPFETLGTLAEFTNSPRKYEMTHVRHKNGLEFVEIAETLEDGKRFRVRIPRNFVGRVAEVLTKFASR